MIVPMKKITLFVLEKEQEEALKALRKQGLVHVEKQSGSGETLASLVSVKNDLTTARDLLSEFISKKDKKADEKTKPSIMSREDTLTFVGSVLKLVETHKENIAKAGRLNEEISRCEIWGDFNLADFAFLAEKGLHLFPAEMPEKLFKDKDFCKNVTRILAGVKNKIAYCLLLRGEAQLPENLSADIRIFTMPLFSPRELKEQLKSLYAKMSSYQTEMKKMSSYINSIEALLKTVNKEIEFETVRSSMSVAGLGGEKESAQGINLVYLTGYVPAETESEVADLAKRKAWAYMSAEPAEDDAVPTKLRHNRIVNLISPLTDFLGTIPGYREPDISFWFLIFFGIFFAMIFGDAGYGAVIILMSAVMMCKAKSKKQKIPTGLYMAMYLGMMTMIWGTLTCSWFGADPKYLPDFIKSLAVHGISSMETAAQRNKNIMHVSFTIGIVHLSIAHIMGIVKNRKSLKLLADVGSLGMLIGMYVVILSIIVSSERYPVTDMVKASIAGGFILNFIFASYEGNIFKSIAESCKNMISMILGVVNVFSDIMSYIRLWAVGLAGAAISMTVNSMAGSMLGGVIIFIGVVLLVFGHGLNCVMNVLSVIVHGVRLNTMEFSNHIGLTWSGFKYMPFSEEEAAEK